MGETETLETDVSVVETTSEQASKQVQNHRDYYSEILLLDLLRTNKITQEEYNIMIQQTKNKNKELH